jgi:hypothetical protein
MLVIRSGNGWERTKLTFVAQLLDAIFRLDVVGRAALAGQAAGDAILPEACGGHGRSVDRMEQQQCELKLGVSARRL